MAGGPFGGYVGTGTPPGAGGVVKDAAFLTAETISGGKAAAFTQSGVIQIAMASVSGRMPAIGIVRDQVASGLAAVVYRFGELFNVSSGTPFDFSGWMNQTVYVGRSGDCVASGPPTSSGDIRQVLGVTIAQSGLLVQVDGPFRGPLQSGDLSSGTVTGQAGGGFFIVASGTLSSFDIASGGVLSGNIASGQVGAFHLASGAANSGHLASGNVITFARLLMEDTKLAGQAISGVLAVALGSGGQYVVPAERQSGLRMPAIAVSLTNAVSGGTVRVALAGFVPAPNSGTIASGALGGLWVGSGGLIVNLSGFCAGPSSGPGVGAFSGSFIQQLGMCVSGGIYLLPNLAGVVLATLSGSYLSINSGCYPVSGFGANVF